MARLAAFSSPLLLGFDDIERLLDRVSKNGSDGYPPYNIERIGASGDGVARIRITLALAGFDQDDISVVVEENELSITGRQKDEPNRDYLHRGIAARQFQRTFVLADGMEVTGAELADGLLCLDLIRREPQRNARRIEITSRQRANNKDKS